MITVIGNPTFDIIRTPHQTDTSIGGGLTYCSLTLLSLGASVQSVGIGDSSIMDFLGSKGADLSHFVSGKTCRFENTYTDQGRQQKAQPGTRLCEAQIPACAEADSVILYSPVLDELSDLSLTRREASFAAVDLQGLLRILQEDGTVKLARTLEAVRALKTCDVLKVDDVEAEALTGVSDPVQSCQALAQETDAILFLTRASRGALLSSKGRRWHFAPLPVQEVDATGAGDVALSSFTFHYGRCKDPVDAARFATCAASLSVTGFGLQGIPSLPTIEARMHEIQVTLL